ncbi:hypothetical protein ACH5RR_000860 [Cinchona calisaya]|uniref:Zinc knuckle CX2CX4HX4C domain-containing protein n=1 Tax=Cinchona calisaya TaxID=153742 RepID=A0ABD3B1W4_9GENT
MCIEIDLTKPRQRQVYVGNGDKGKWQTIDYEYVPEFCLHFCKIGHGDAACVTENSQLKNPLSKPNEGNPMEASTPIFENPRLQANDEGNNGSKKDTRSQKQVQWVPKQLPTQLSVPSALCDQSGPSGLASAK